MMTFQFAGTTTSTSSTSFMPSRSGRKRRISASAPAPMLAERLRGRIEIDEVEAAEGSSRTGFRPNWLLSKSSSRSLRGALRQAAV